MKSKDIEIEKIIAHIKNQIGIELSLDNDFPGIRKHVGQRYFNIDLKERPYTSDTYAKLRSICGQNNIIKRVESNGLNRVAIFF